MIKQSAESIEKAPFQGSPWGELSPEATERGPRPRRAGQATLCKGGCQLNGDPNATQRSGCVWERRSDGAREQSRYTVRDCGRYAVRDDEGDCNLHGQFGLRNGRRTADYNPSGTSLRTCHLPLHRGGFFAAAGRGTKAKPHITKRTPASIGTGGFLMFISFSALSDPAASERSRPK